MVAAGFEPSPNFLAGGGNFHLLLKKKKKKKDKILIIHNLKYVMFWYPQAAEFLFSVYMPDYCIHLS